MKPIKEALIFNTIHDLYSSVGLGNKIDKKCEFSIFNLADIHTEFPYTSPVYRSNFFSFFFVKDCYGKCSTDGIVSDAFPGSVYIDNPGHYKTFTWYAIKEVYLITLTESFLKENVHADVFEAFPFLLSENIPPKVLALDAFTQFEQVYKQILKEYITASPYRNKLIGYLFVIILIKIKEFFWNDYDPVTEGSRPSEIVRKFKITLEQHYRDLSSGRAEKAFRVQEYADAQNLHPNYLSTVIKSKTGKAVGTWIAEKTIAEAKSMLRNSSASIKEISYLLGFSESAHFSNYFKKRTKVSPALFRKEYNISEPKVETRA